MGSERVIRTKSARHGAGAHRRPETDSADGPAIGEIAAHAAPPVRAGLIVGRADDPAEAAADRMADAALDRLRGRTPAAPSDTDRIAPGPVAIARSVAPPATAAVVGAAGGDLDGATERLVESERGRGEPLPAPVLGRMQTAFGRNLSGVRVHSGAGAARASAAVSAQAFTTGSDVFFGAGHFAPDSPDGERILAHEIAHVVQGNGSGSAVRRDSSDSSAKQQQKQQKKTEAKKVQQDKKDQAAKRRADRKEQQAQQKADKKQAKTNAKQSKVAQKQQSKKLAADRKEGQAGRAKLSGEVAGTGAESSSFNTLQNEFTAALAAEKDRFEVLVGRGFTEEAARDQAYSETWLLGPDAERLKPVRPPRETASERLRSDVRTGRLNERVRASMQAQTELGTMLPKAVETLYEQAATEVDRLMDPPDSLSRPQAEAMAEKSVWGSAPDKVRKQRPQRGSDVDVQAVKDARRRIGVRIEPLTKPSKTDTVKNVTGKINSVLGNATTLSPAVTSPLTVKGTPKDNAAKEAATGDPVPVTGGGEQQIPLGIGTFVKSVQDSASRVDRGKDKDAASNITLSDETRASNGIGTVLGIFGDLNNLVTGGMKLAESAQTAYTEKSARNIMAATKSGADGAKTVVSLARNAANLAKTIDAGVSSAVASVVPGLNIATAVLSIVSNTLSMADAAMRMQETNQALFGARSRAAKPGEPVDVMILPLLRVSKSHIKKVEQTVWNTSISIADLATSIATVASGGGYGIPAAVQAGVKVVDLFHNLGHFVADQVLVAVTKQIQSESLQSLEGSAEAGFRHDPAMAVDGIIQRATGGDTVAQQFLANYRVNGKPIDMAVLTKLNPAEARKQAAGADGGPSTATGNELLLGKVRAAVLAGMAEDEDPQFFYEKWRKSIGDKINAVQKQTTGKWNTVGKLADDRNQRDDADRGVGWKMKMMFSTQTKLGRKARQEQAKAAPAIGPVRDRKILCLCGGAELRIDASAKDQETFLTAVKAMSDQVILDGAKDPANGESQELLLEVIRARVADKVAAGNAP